MLPSAPVPSTHLHFFTVKKTTSNYSQLNCSKFIFCKPYKMLLVWISLDFREPRVISMALSNVYIPWPFPTQQEKKITWLGLRNEGPSGVIPEEFQEGAICAKSNAFVQNMWEGKRFSSAFSDEELRLLGVRSITAGTAEKAERLKQGHLEQCRTSEQIFSTRFPYRLSSILFPAKSLAQLLISIFKG